MPYLKEVEISDDTSVSVDAYSNITPETVKTIKKIAPSLRGTTIVHVNATPVGGGVAELLNSQIALERSLGLDSHWLIINDVPSAFFDVTKKMHNVLQGKREDLTQEEKNTYLAVNKKLAESLAGLDDLTDCILVVHDPQPLAMLAFTQIRHPAIIRLHIDLSTPNPQAVEFLRPYMQLYSYLVLTSKEYMPAFSWFPQSQVRLIPPAIDPISEKNQTMSLAEAHKLLSRFGIDPNCPLLTQVSRFDPWKDPHGVIRAFREVQETIPNAQLVLAGFITAKDDPEAAKILESVEAERKGDKNILLFSDPSVLEEIKNDVFIRALYTASDVVFQKSLREGFGMTTTEAMWKGKAVISGNTVGGRMQIESGKNGFLVNSSDEAAQAALTLLEDKERARRMGAAAHESVVDQFVITHYLLDHLKMYQEAKDQGGMPISNLISRPVSSAISH